MKRSRARLVASRSIGRLGAIRDPRGIVCRRHGLVYFPVPKAASTSIKTMIAGWEGLAPGDVHQAEFARVRASRLREVPGAFAFTVVRNPWDRLHSCFQDKVVDGAARWGEVHDGLLRYNALTRRRLFWAEMTFEQFVRTVARIPDALADEHLRNQVRLVGPWGKPPVVDRWVDFDRVDDELPALLASRGVDTAALPHLRAHSTGDYRDAYSPATRELAARRYRRDIEHFAFEF